MTDLTENNQEEPKKPASELDDESLFDRLFPNAVVEWVREAFGGDDEEE